MVTGLQRRFTLDPELPRESCIERHGDTVYCSDSNTSNVFSSTNSVRALTYRRRHENSRLTDVLYGVSIAWKMPRFKRDDANSGGYCMWLASSNSISDQRCLVSNSILHAPANTLITRVKGTKLRVVLCTSYMIGVCIKASLYFPFPSSVTVTPDFA